MEKRRRFQRLRSPALSSLMTDFCQLSLDGFRWDWGTSVRSRLKIKAAWFKLSSSIEGVLFALSVGIKIASPQAVQVRIHFPRKTSSVAPQWGTWLRTHHWSREIQRKKEKRKKHSTGLDSNPWPLCHQPCALPLCYSPCPAKTLGMTGAAIFDNLIKNTR